MAIMSTVSIAAPIAGGLLPGTVLSVRQPPAVFLWSAMETLQPTIPDDFA